MILGDRISNRLQQHGFAGAWRRDDEAALALPNWRDQVDDARRKIVGRDFHPQHLVRIERRQVVKEYFFARLLGRFKIDRLDFDQREITLAFLWRANLSANRVAGAQVELANLRGRNVNVVRARQIVVFRSAQKSETVGQRL